MTRYGFRYWALFAVTMCTVLALVEWEGRPPGVLGAAFGLTFWATWTVGQREGRTP